MRFSAKSSLIGVGAGAALTLLVLDLWGRHYANEYFESAPDMPASPIPATYTLDRQGVIVFRAIGGVNWDADNVRAFLRSLENR